MKTFKEMTKEELRKEAATRGIKNYIIMPTMKLVEALEEDERRKQSVVDQLGQDAKTKVERVIEFYDGSPNTGLVIYTRKLIQSLMIAR